MAPRSYCQEFGRLFKERRRCLGKTLREFCKEHGLDHGNISRLERGLLRPPTGERLEEYLSYLGVERESDEWYKLRDAAYACAGEVPEEIMAEEDLVRQLPVVFRTLGRKRPTEEDLEKLIDLLRKEAGGGQR